MSSQIGDEVVIEEIEEANLPQLTTNCTSYSVYTLYSAICIASGALPVNHLFGAPSQGRLLQCRLGFEHDTLRHWHYPRMQESHPFGQPAHTTYHNQPQITTTYYNSLQKLSVAAIIILLKSKFKLWRCFLVHVRVFNNNDQSLKWMSILNHHHHHHHQQLGPSKGANLSTRSRGESVNPSWIEEKITQASSFERCFEELISKETFRCHLPLLLWLILPQILFLIISFATSCHVIKVEFSTPRRSLIVKFYN